MDTIKKYIKQYYLTSILTIIYSNSGTVCLSCEPNNIRLIPWTIEHSLEWQKYELSDTTVSYFRRNEYFDDCDTLLLRDSHWIKFCKYVQSHIGISFVFPALGLAIISTENNDLVGTIRFKLSHKKGYLSLGYGLIRSTRNQKLGSNVIKHLKSIVDQHIGLPIAMLKTSVNKETFMNEWYKQSNKSNPNFNVLLNFISPKTTPFIGITASVDIKNYPSYALLIKDNILQSIDIECSKYSLIEKGKFFDMSICFIYPPRKEYNNTVINTIVTNLLSKNNNLIRHTENELKKIFNLNSSYNYVSLNKTEKAQLRLNETLESTTFFSQLGYTMDTPFIKAKL